MATTTWKNIKSKENYSSRGRKADRPREVPLKGWKDILIRVKSEVSDDHLSIVAAGMAYYSILAFVPALTSLVLLYAWISDPSQISNHLNSMSHLIPPDVKSTIDDLLTSLSSKATSTGVAAISALALSLWSASKGSKALMDGLNIIYDEKEQRGFFKTTFLALGLTFLAIVMGILALGVIVGLPAASKLLNLGQAFEVMIVAVSWILLLGLFSFYLACAYRFGPFRDNPKWRWVSWGAMFSSISWAIVSGGFSWYVTSFGNFDKTYGSMGAIIILLMWLYLSSFVILLGGEINAELEHQTAKDSTTGPDQPLGKRGAKMADTLGKGQGPESAT